MGQRRSKLDRHGAELLALRRAGATVAQTARWLRIERGTIVASTTLGRWLDRVDDREIDQCHGFDAVAVLDELRARDRELRFPRLAVSRIDEHGYDVLRMRAEAPRSASATGRCTTTTGCASTAPPSPAGCGSTAMAKQAAGIVKRLQGGRIKSVGTARNYQERLAQIAARIDVALAALTPERAVAYLQARAVEVGQKDPRHGAPGRCRP